MGLQDVVNIAQTNILLDPRVPAGLTFAFGPKYREAHVSPPYVVWVPVSGPVEGAEKSVATADPNQIFTRRCTVEAHCWGATYAAAESLAEVVWAGFYAYTVGSFTPKSESPDTPDWLERGWLITLQFEILIPVLKPADNQTTPTTITLNFSEPH